MRAFNYIPPQLEPRLQNRFQQLVQQHLHSAQTVAAGMKALPGVSSTFASTQAAWRFYQNPSILLPDLAKPLLEHGREAIQKDCQRFGLVMHDWSSLSYSNHKSKKDRKKLQHRRHWGYELQSCLLVSDRDGQPLAPLVEELNAKAGVYSTRSEQVLPEPTRSEQMSQRMDYLSRLGLARPLVNLADREFDSVGHFRKWQKDHQLFIVRAKGNRRVQCQGQEQLLKEAVKGLPLTFCRTVEYHGKEALQYVGEMEVVLHRAARPTRPVKGKRRNVAGAPLRLRVIVSEVRLNSGRCVATWILLSNLPKEVSAAEIALWYYWRWKIESFFKLLKSAGHHVEEWQQENAQAIARRLLVASMACVLVWQLARQTTAQAEALKLFLVRLSGRQMKRTKPWTIPALMEGIWTLLAALDALEADDGTQLANFVAWLSPLFTKGKT
jgi:IS4 transposase